MTVGIDEIMSSYVFSVELVTVQQRRINLANSNRERESDSDNSQVRSSVSCWWIHHVHQNHQSVLCFFMFFESMFFEPKNFVLDITSLDSLDMEPLWRLCIFERHRRWCCHRLACWYGQRRWCLQHDKEASQNKPIVNEISNNKQP